MGSEMCIRDSSEPFLDLLDQHGTEWEWEDYRDRAPAPGEISA